ncbi:MAG: tetratricopeptide repeat protein [Desulfobacter sp.]|nr:MAG: tetratricopeptide repeat protein [Desulfobacter sp.]
MGAIYLFKKQYQQAIDKGEQAVALNPGNSKAAAQLGRTLAYAARYKESIKWFEKAIRLDPRTENWILTVNDAESQFNLFRRI